MITPFKNHHPRIAPGVYVDVSARIMGRVTLEAGVSIWPGAVLRADEEEIIIQRGSAVLDLCLLEAPRGHPVIVGPGSLVSHMACLHGAVVEQNALVGIKALVLDGSRVGKGALVAAGALVTPGTKVEPGALVMGAPARMKRMVSDEERDNLTAQLDDLRQKAAEHLRVQNAGYGLK